MPPPYVPLSLNFFGDEKVVELTPLAQLVYIVCLVVAKRNETDGRVTRAQVRREQPLITDYQPLFVELVTAGLLVETDDRALAIPPRTWLKWNRSSAELDVIRAARSEAGRKGGKQSGLVRSKQVASDGRSKSVQHVEATVEAQEKRREDKASEDKTNQREAAVPDDFRPTAADYDFAHSQGITLDLEKEAVKFTEHHRSTGTRCIDWHARFRKWLANDKGPRGPKPSCTVCGIDGSTLCPYGPDHGDCPRGSVNHSDRKVVYR